MRPSQRAVLEQKIKLLCREQKYQKATYAIIQGYGPEVLGWLSSLVKEETIAEDLFQKFCLALWQGLPGFRWESQLFTWAYKIAWREFLAFRKGKQKEKECQFSPSQLSKFAEEVTTIHSKIQKKRLKHRLVVLRQQLPEELQSLLILRVDREMSFAAIAEILATTEGTARKRFQRAKEQLKSLVEMEKSKKEIIL